MKQSTTIRVAICDATGVILVARGMSKKRFHIILFSDRFKGQAWRFSLTSVEKAHFKR